jgi:demethylmenaquinone methyltransferase/2-methoxy-6-polyprenyl-1,4-benzoquinol methylase
MNDETTPARGAPAAEVRAMFARIAPTYDLLNGVLSARRDRRWRRLAAATIDPGARRILDLCAGTGDLALEIASSHPQAFVCAGDFCFEMLQRGGPKGLKRAAAPATLDALRLPFADGTFDAVTAAFGVRNFEDLEAGLADMRRVTRSGGQLAVLEFFRSESAWRDRPFRSTSGMCCPASGGSSPGTPVRTPTYRARSVASRPVVSSRHCWSGPVTPRSNIMT